MRKRPKAEITEKVRSVLHLVQLPDVGTRYPRQLSGGQQQRIAVARALATEPDILLFDEPLSNLDAKLREYMRFELRQLLEQLKITTVYVTHDQAEAMVVGDRLIVMNQGRIVQDDAPSAVYRSPANRFVADFIGSGSFLPGPSRPAMTNKVWCSLRQMTALRSGAGVHSRQVRTPSPASGRKPCVLPMAATSKPRSRRSPTLAIIRRSKSKSAIIAFGQPRPTSLPLGIGERVAVAIDPAHCPIINP